MPTNPKPSASKSPTSPKHLWAAALILLLLLISLFVLHQRSTTQYRSLEQAQSQLQQALENTDSLQAAELEALTQRIAQLRTELDTDIPAELKSQYDELTSRLTELTQSSNSSIASTAQTLLSSLTNQAGEGIALSGTNNTTIQNTGVISLNNQTGSLSLQGTPNQTSVTQNGSTTTIGTAQDIAPSSSPTFDNQTLTGNSSVQGSQSIGGNQTVGSNLNVTGNTTTNTLTIQSSGTQNGYALCDISNNCGYSGAGSSYVQGGNSFGNPATLGTNDNNSLSLRTNNQNRVTIDTSGNTSFTGNITTPGSVTASSFTGNGANLTNVNAATLQGLTTGNSSGQIALNNGTLNTNLNADLLDGQHGSFYQNADNINTGTLSDARLSANVALQNAANTFSLQQTFTGGFQGTNGTLSGNFTVNGATALQGLTATGILQNGFSVCDASNNCNYATSAQFANAILQGGNSFGTAMSIGTNDGQSLALRTAGSDKVWITDSGNVGIGFNTPTERLHVRINTDGADGVSIRNVNVGATAAARLQINTEGGGDSWINFRVAGGGIQHWSVGVDTSDAKKFKIGNSAALGGPTRLTIDTDGNIGIGTTTPSERLQVAGNGLFSGSITGTSLFQGTNQVCDNSNNCNYAAATGGTGYIQNQTASPQTAGFNITGNGTIGGALLVQGGISSPGAGLNSERFGFNANAAGVESMAIGRAATASNNNSIAIGRNAVASGSVAIAIGSSATANGNSSIGIGSTGTSAGAIAIGLGSAASGGNFSIALGYQATTTQSGQLVVGSSGGFVSNGFFGNGVTAVSPTSFTFNASGGSGENIQGGNIAIAGGRGTGNAAGGNILFQTSNPGSTGTTLNALTTRAQIHGGSGNMSIGTTSDLGQLAVVNTNASQVGLVVRGASNQAGSVNIMEVRNNSNDNLLVVSANGRVGFGTVTGTGPAHGLLMLRSATTATATPTEGAGVIVIRRLTDDGGPASASTGAIVFGTNDNRIWRSGSTTRIMAHSGVQIGNDGSNGSSTATILTLRPRADHTGSLLQAQDSTGAVLASISASGKLTVKSAEVEGDLVVVGSITTTNITVNGKIIGNADTRGTVTVASGNTSASHIFTTPYDSVPNLVATPGVDPGSRFWVSDVTTTGFTINTSDPVAGDTEFRWQAQQ